MRIAKDTVVTLSYRVTDTDGNIVDEGAEPIIYLHGGYDGLFPRLEAALEGKEAGHELNIKLQPEDAFGEYDAELVSVEDAAMFPANVQVGMQFERVMDGNQDEAMLFSVTDVADGKVVVDGNHPLAGMALIFDCTVADIRAASAEEVEHGHPHFPGHHHH
ncbi:FKBP-type peptidyl-prolyl cis-trans isomerase SlyD [Paramagnetospirillum magnetotacticum MS-1]|uniref:peptidylprolyl isomerase n=1 Tax=Paramagnetospirillum magnetotacticum MS-1 TaxID=272627 RepID=A0A0C2YAP0_PARME|nr:peptidylprolyl isomerase [Paramagnetospirillum magnetotacticum]KIL96824.1 FKBP-type peptidyl-prolyl cis-trans isomerase SlyD [Paramagnetospirillum magnetotacticum MS-1]